MKQSPYQLFMGVVLLCTVTFLSWQAGSLAAAGVQFIHAENGSGEKKKYIVCVDPGHGGTDPGKVGINGQWSLPVIKTWGFILLVTLIKKWRICVNVVS